MEAAFGRVLAKSTPQGVLPASMGRKQSSETPVHKGVCKRRPVILHKKGADGHMMDIRPEYTFGDESKRCNPSTLLYPDFVLAKMPARYDPVTELDMTRLH